MRIKITMSLLKLRCCKKAADPRSQIPYIQTTNTNFYWVFDSFRSCAKKVSPSDQESNAPATGTAHKMYHTLLLNTFYYVVCDMGST